MIREMTNELHYGKSPLNEAVIDIRVNLPSNVELSTLVGIDSRVESEYPTKRDHFHIEGEIEFGEEIVSTGTRTPNGYLFVSNDGLQFFQARLDGFAFNRLRPYTSWNEFRDEARRLWGIYCEHVRPESVVRMAVRYINRLELPLPFRDTKEFLRVSPEVPPDFPNGALSNYFMQLRMPQPDLKSLLIINQGFAFADNVSLDELVSLPIVLDIDLFKEVDIPQSDAEMWDLFEQFRIRKNQAFEASITERMREVIR